MTAKLISRQNNELTIEVKINTSGSMLDKEDSILKACNQLGSLATTQALEDFDTDGSIIKIASIKLSSKGKYNKKYQTPYGAVDIKRHVYQNTKGGKTYCPLDESARIVRDSTPRFAKVLSNKYARMSGSETVDDLNDNHDRKISLSFLQNISDAVSAIAQIKEEKWEYHLPDLTKKEAITTIVLSMDGTTVLTREYGYRETMVGTISLYDIDGDRKHSIYIGAAPEYGKDHFKKRMTEEIEHIKRIYPNALYLAIADGAKDNWTFLEKHTSRQTLDFYHASEYLTKASEAIIQNNQQRKEWLKNACHNLKHNKDGPKNLLDEMTKTLKQNESKSKKEKKLNKTQKQNIDSAITYFTNNINKMNYAQNLDMNLPIGSGVTEAACKTLIKQRLCRSGMKWKDKGIKIVLSLRELVQTKGRWKQFWNKINQYGVPVLD
jgi:quinol monooxygenase YgiN